MPVPRPHIITCPQWLAHDPLSAPVIARHSERGLLHHTDGHHPEISNPRDETVGEAKAYARQIQDFHMGVRGWNDSGHNFLVTRSGLILQGRWGTVSAIEAGRMVVSAHCPGQNNNPGVEFEHLPGEAMTPRQRTAGVDLYAWIFDKLNIPPTNLFGHRDFYATSCPDNLYPLIMGMRAQIASVLNDHGRMRARKRGLMRAHRAVKRELKT